jgi:putative two-component system response regulator
MNTKLNITYETEFVRNEGGRILEIGNKHVVIVDDDDMSLQYAGKLIKEEGIKVTSFNSGKALVDYISSVETLPDLILLDINMPEMDGYTAYDEIKKLGGDAARTAVIFLSADSDDGAEVKGLSMGAMDFIRKPFIPGVLKLRVNHTLELVMLRKRYHKGRQEQQGDK